MRKTSGNLFLGHQREGVYHLFLRFHSNMGVSQGCPFQNFCGSYYNIQFKPYATSKMELFKTKNRKQLETVADCCYRELHLKCSRDPRCDSERHKQIQIFLRQGLHPAFTLKKNPNRNVSNIFKVTINSPVRRLLLLLLTLNIFRNLFYCYCY